MDIVRSSIKHVLIGLCCILAMNSNAQDAADQLHTLLKEYSTFSAKFQQVTLAENGREAQKTAGFLSLAKPNLFRWETEVPFPQEIVSDGQYVWIYDPDLEQVTQRLADSQQGSAPALILNGQIEELKKDYAINLVADSGSDQIFELKPLSDQYSFSNIRLAFSAGTISELMLEDSLGQRTSIVFHDQDVNPQLDEQTFFFRVPADADLLVDIEG